MEIVSATANEANLRSSRNEESFAHFRKWFIGTTTSIILIVIGAVVTFVKDLFTGRT